jgi:hypothetical protein
MHCHRNFASGHHHRRAERHRGAEAVQLRDADGRLMLIECTVTVISRCARAGYKPDIASRHASPFTRQSILRHPVASNDLSTLLCAASEDIVMASFTWKP